MGLELHQERLATSFMKSSDVDFLDLGRPFHSDKMIRSRPKLVLQ